MTSSVLRSEIDAAAARLSNVLSLKYGDRKEGWGWGPRLRSTFGYHTPDDWYEALLLGLVTDDTHWLDVGCGRDVFPTNAPAAKLLAGRCRLLVGIDPHENVLDNPFVHESVKSSIEDYVTDRRFDLITLRMVAEHIAKPDTAVAALGRLTKPGGRVVIYTVKKWAPVSIVAAATPMFVHHAVKRILWHTEERDTFPVEYKMNTQKHLRQIFARAGFEEEGFRELSDCRSFQRWKVLNFAELSVWRALQTVGLEYPEACILAIYRKSAH